MARAESAGMCREIRRQTGKRKGLQDSEIFQYSVYHLHMATNGNSAQHIYTPSELNREVRLHIEMGFPRILLEAEISILSKPASGHLYFTLKDDEYRYRLHYQANFHALA